MHRAFRGPAGSSFAQACESFDSRFGKGWCGDILCSALWPLLAVKFEQSRLKYHSMMAYFSMYLGRHEARQETFHEFIIFV